jgi:hypothetical protein
VIRLGNSLAAGVDSVLQTDANLDDERLLLRDLLESKAPEYPEPAARLVAHLLEYVDARRFWDHSALSEFVGIVKADAPADVIDRIRSSALRLGISGAASW